MAEDLTKLSQREFERRRANVERELAEVNAKRARLIGQIEGRFDTLSEDKVFVDALRVQAWMRARPELVITSDDTGLKGAPDGWPESMPDPEAYISEEISRRRDAYIESKFGQTETTMREPSVTPSVSKFREMAGIGEET